VIVHQSNNSRRAYSLIEMCAVMGTLGITLSLGAIILLVAMRANQVGGATLLQIRLRTDVGDTFRTDVADAVAAPANLGNSSRSATCLILRQSGGNHVVYEWQNGQLTRTVHTADRESRTILSIGIPDISVEFDVPAGDRPVILMRVTESLGHGAIRRSEFAAALGGNRR
jgi:type II secretory pathway pseudopilin PulG